MNYGNSQLGSNAYKCFLFTAISHCERCGTAVDSGGGGGVRVQMKMGNKNGNGNRNGYGCG